MNLNAGQSISPALLYPFSKAVSSLRPATALQIRLAQLQVHGKFKA